MFRDIKNVIMLTDQDPLKGVCFSLWHDNIDRIEEFKYLCYANLPKDLSWFHQGNSTEWQMFEFWKPNWIMIPHCHRIAQNMKLPLVIALTKVFDVPDGLQKDLHTLPFKSFDQDFHTFGDFP